MPRPPKLPRGGPPLPNFLKRRQSFYYEGIYFEVVPREKPPSQRCIGASHLTTELNLRTFKWEETLHVYVDPNYPEVIYHEVAHGILHLQGKLNTEVEADKLAVLIRKKFPELGR